VPGSHQRIVDAHVHLWDRARFDYAWLADEETQLQRSFGPRDLAAELGGAGVPDAEVVFVQADCDPSQSIAEAMWVQGLADSGFPAKAIVAAAPLEFGDDAEPHLEALGEVALVTGVRRLTQDEADGFMGEPGFVDGVRLLARHGFTMDLCIRSHQLAEATELVAACPEVTFVLDHLGKPAIDPVSFGGWAADLGRLAQLPNVRCKLSGLATEASGPLNSPDAVAPWLEHGISVFGSDRCMFGSDWPVLTTVAGYAWWLAAVGWAVGQLEGREAERVWVGTAGETYDPLRRQQRQKESATWH